MFAVAGVSLMARRRRSLDGLLPQHARLRATPTSIEANGPLLFWTSVEALRWIVPILLAALAVR
jgi:hypothetical protein